jgi:hypothetical protein
MEVSLKYVFFKSDEHEMLLSAGVSWDVGGTGSKKVGAESFDTVTPTLFFGKGFGDLPESLDYAKPFAITGSIGLALPTRRYNEIRTTEADGTVTSDREKNITSVQWGFSFQYNLQYLQSYVRDVGLPQPFSRMIPIVELALETPTNDPKTTRTTGTVNPGIIWFGKFVQLDRGRRADQCASGKNVGVLGQVHFYLDDILPQVLSWTPFWRRAGPTQPRQCNSSSRRGGLVLMVALVLGAAEASAHAFRPLGSPCREHARPGSEPGPGLVRRRDRAGLQHDPCRERRQAARRQG